MPKGKRGKTVRELVALEQKGGRDYGLPQMPHEHDRTQLSLHRAALGEHAGLSAAQMRFLLAYSVTGNITRACAEADIERRTHYRWLTAPEYESAFIEATKLADDYLEDVAWQLSTGRLTKPVVSAGKLVTEERIYDTRLLHRLLAARRPDKYGNKVDVTSNGQSLVKLVDRDAWDAV